MIVHILKLDAKQFNSVFALFINENTAAAILSNQQPTVFQSLDGRQFYVAVPTTGVIPPQMTSPTNAIVQPQPPNYATTNTNQDCKA